MKDYCRRYSVPIKLDMENGLFSFSIEKSRKEIAKNISASEPYRVG